MVNFLRALLSRVGPRVLVAAALAVAVVATLALAKLAGGGTRLPTFTDPDHFPSQTGSAEPTSDDGESPEPTPSYDDNLAVLSVATNFAKAWLRRDLSAAQWLAGISKLATPSLQENLAGVDPKSVPATAILAEPVLVLRADSLAQVSIAVDTGVLRLRLLKPDTNWQVDGVDWDRV